MSFVLGGISPPEQYGWRPSMTSGYSESVIRLGMDDTTVPFILPIAWGESMRIALSSRRARITTIAVSALVSGGLLPAMAKADTGPTVYVDNTNAACTDTGATAGTQATPFCTLSLARPAIVPGSTVLVAPSAKPYDDLYLSGDNQHGTVDIKAEGPGVVVDSGLCGTSKSSGFTIFNLPNVTIDGFTIDVCGNAALDNYSSDGMSFVHNTVVETAQAPAPNQASEVLLQANNAFIADDTFTTVSANTTAVDADSGTGTIVRNNKITGAGDTQAFTDYQPMVYVGTANSQILWNTISRAPGAGLQIDKNATVSVVSDNYLPCDETGLAITNGEYLQVSGNTVVAGHGTGISITGTEYQVSLENSIVESQDPNISCGLGDAGPFTALSVDASSGANTVADYNLLYAAQGSAYNWGGTTYATAAAFTGTTHQGSHDIVAPALLDTNAVPLPHSPALDSGNPDAPGTVGTDLAGNPHFHFVNNTTPFIDRGALEHQFDDQPPTPTPPPQTTPPPPVTNPGHQASVRRIGGADRYQTSVLVSQSQWKSGSANAVVLARGDQAPGALAGVPLAAHVHGPLLLTNPATMDQATSTEIARVTGGPSPDKTVYILGGDSAVSPSIESGLRAAGYHVVRYKGDDRYGTARAVASAFGNTSHVIVATGKDFPDALAAGPLGAVENAPIVLSNGDTLDPATAAFVLAHPAIDPVGGAAQRAVTKLNTAGKTVTTLAGQTRYETAAAVAGAVARVTGHTPTGVGIASGESFPDALTGGAYAANAGIPLLITENDTLAAPTRYQLSGWAHALTTVTVFGGQKAVSSGVMSDIASAVSGRIG